MIESVTRESAKYAELPHKFEAGTVNAAGAIALHAAIKYAQSVGFDVMQERELAVTKRAFDGLKELPHVHVLDPTGPKNTPEFLHLQLMTCIHTM